MKWRISGLNHGKVLGVGSVANGNPFGRGILRMGPNNLQTLKTLGENVKMSSMGSDNERAMRLK